MTTPRKIPGFSNHSDRYRAFVSLNEHDALSVRREADERDLTVSDVLKERVRRGSAVTAASSPLQSVPVAFVTPDGAPLGSTVIPAGATLRFSLTQPGVVVVELPADGGRVAV